MKILLTLLILHIQDYMLPCFTKSIFGVDCPGCGLQRSVAFILQGDFSAAWDMYPAIFAILPLFTVLGVDYFYTLKHANKAVITLMIISVGLILSNYIFKFI